MKPRKQHIVIECKDLDEVTSQEDVCATLRQQFNLSDLEDSAMQRMKKAYGDTQVVIVSLPVESGIKLITAGQVKIS